MPSLRGPSRPDGTKKTIFNSNQFDGVVIMAKTGAKEKDCDSPRGKGRDMERFAKERDKNERIPGRSWTDLRCMHAHSALCSFGQTEYAHDLFCSSGVGFLPVPNGKSSTRLRLSSTTLLRKCVLSVSVTWSTGTTLKWLKTKCTGLNGSLKRSGRAREYGSVNSERSLETSSRIVQRQCEDVLRCCRFAAPLPTLPSPPPSPPSPPPFPAPSPPPGPPFPFSRHVPA